MTLGAIVAADEADGKRKRWGSLRRKVGFEVAQITAEVSRRS